MKINGSEVNITESADKIGQCKKKWIKPEVEMISNDLIKNGFAPSYREGQPTLNGIATGGGS